MSLHTIAHIFALAFCVRLIAAAVTPVCPPCLTLSESISYALVGTDAISWTAWAVAGEWAGLLAALGVGAVGVWLIERWKVHTAAQAAASSAGDANHAEAVRQVVNALGGQHGKPRVEMLKMLERRLPYRLTAQEAAALLGGERGSQRVDMLQVLEIRLPSQLAIDEAVTLLGPLRGSTRVDAIRLLVYKLADGTDISPLLVTLDGSQRVEATRLLN